MFFNVFLFFLKGYSETLIYDSNHQYNTQYTEDVTIFYSEQTFLTFIFPVIQYFIAEQTFLTFIFPVNHNKH